MRTSPSSASGGAVTFPEFPRGSPQKRRASPRSSRRREVDKLPRELVQMGETSRRTNAQQLSPELVVRDLGDEHLVLANRAAKPLAHRPVPVEDGRLGPARRCRATTSRGSGAHGERCDLVELPVGFIANVLVLPAIEHCRDPLRTVHLGLDARAASVVRGIGGGAPRDHVVKIASACRHDTCSRGLDHWR